jgi:hypothetical protein
MPLNLKLSAHAAQCGGGPRLCRPPCEEFLSISQTQQLKKFPHPHRSTTAPTKTAANNPAAPDQAYAMGYDDDGNSNDDDDGYDCPHGNMYCT